jgi:hypothetical protein
MKKIVIYFTLICCSFSFQNCSDQNLLPDKSISKSKEGMFMDEVVYLDNGLSQEILDQKPEEFLNELYKSNASARTNGENDLGINHKVLMDFVNNKLEKYPEFDMEKLQIRRFDILKKDFPNIKTKEEAFEISGKIVEFYDVKLRQDIKENLDNLKKNSSKSRLIGIGDANAMEISYSVMHVLAGSKVALGAIDGDAWTSEKFPGLGIDNNDLVNSYRHTIWAMNSVAKMLVAGMPKFDALGKTRDFLTLHEMQYVGNLNGLKPTVIPNSLYALHLQWGLGQANPNAMDLSNDAIGRSLIDNQTSKPLFSGWKGVSKASIVSTMATKIDPPATFRQSSNIIGTYQNNNWMSLANNIYGGGSTPLYKID